MTIGCTEPDCGRIALYRGKCLGHYRRYAKLVSEGKTTWAKLERQGQVEKQKRGKDGIAR